MKVAGCRKGKVVEMKKCKILGIAAASAIMLTGCIDAMPELTAEQSGMVAEYAAGLLLKYSPRYDYMLVSESELKAALSQREFEAQMPSEMPAQEESSEAVGTKESKEPADNEETKPEESAADASTETTPEQQFENADADLVAQLGLNEKVSLKYQSFEICDSYPKNATGYSGVDAAKGKKLLVMHFNVENSTNETVQCALYDYSMRIRADVNDGTRANAKDTPMLPDDMVSYDGELKAGEKADLAAVVEIPEMSDADIASLTLSVSSSKGECAIRIR